MADFDVKEEHSNKHFKGKIDFPEHWQIVMIVGGSFYFAKERKNDGKYTNYLQKDR